ncbi:nodulation protein NodZ [Rhizobium sp. IBUN]|uniref:nodulation protein NodZ n=1 Tax=Rhizobium sp. IBUN TaxID=1042326 RepID=UPI00040B61AC|nr:nodulation protein NodZ [Rhizobium sp. IBUN]
MTGNADLKEPPKSRRHAQLDPICCKVLLTKAKGGFGNRMLSAVTGIVLAELGGRVPVIDWRDGMYGPAGVNVYPLLFNDPVGIDPGRFDDECDVAPALWSGQLSSHPVDIVRERFPRSHSNPFIYRKLSIDLAGLDPPQSVGVFWSYLPKLSRLRRRMRHDLRFAGRPHNDIMHEKLKHHFSPVGPVLEAVEGLFANRACPVIGVHIRFTDRKVSVPRIEREVRRIRERIPDSDIFLATDNAEVQARVMAAFHRVFVVDKSLAVDGRPLHVAADSFDDPLREARNALIDMWALSRCDWLVHSSQSTFSVTAALIGRIPETRQVDIDGRNPKVLLKRWFQSFS